MADNVISDSGNSLGPTFATDNISAGGADVHYPLIKLAFGALNSVTVVAADAGLPVNIISAIPLALSGSVLAAITGTVNISGTPTVSIVSFGAAVAISGSVLAAVTGTVNISGTAAVVGTVNISGTATVDGRVGLVARSSGAADTGRFINTLTNTFVIKAASGVLYGIQAFNLSTAPVFVKLYDLATTPVVGTSTPKKVLMCPGGATTSVGGGFVWNFPIGITCSAGISIGLATGNAGLLDGTATGPGSAEVVVNVDFF